MDFLSHYSEKFNSALATSQVQRQPVELYQPINYILDLGGKRLRPLLTLMAADAFGAQANEAMKAALAVEIFHNFTLIHDDIMDDAPIRRGLATVHEKWDINTGILSGDAMMILAYRQLEQYEDDRYFQLMKVLNQVALEVCEGQQLDVNFETQISVSESEYMTMIRKKTAVLVAAALQMGAIVARASDSDQNSIYSYGVELGMAFQLQDDYLDAFGDPKTFGKQVGGDIIENKKTFLYLKAIELLDAEASKSLQKLFNEVQVSTEIKVEQVKSFFLQSKADEVLKLRIDEHTQNALNALESTSLRAASKEQFRQFAVWLMTRVS